LFFDFLFPFPTVLNFALFKKKIGDTEYGLGWFPLGGYVKIAGMIDESMDEEFLKSEPQPYEFRSKPAWQRLIIMLGGIMMNLILAWMIYSQMLYWWGESYLPVENAKYGFAPDSTAAKVGIKAGDKIVSYDGGKMFSSALKVPIDLLVNNAKSIEVERDGQKISLPIHKEIYKEMMASKGSDFVSPIFPANVDTLIPGWALSKAGGKQGDKIIQIDSLPIRYFHECRAAVQQFKGQEVPMLVLRGSDTVKLNVSIPDSGIIGFSTNEEKYITVVEKSYGFIGSFPAGAAKAYESLANYIKQFRLIFDPDLKGYKQVGSFIMIAQNFSPKWDWKRFWGLTAWLSLALAFVNLLPIPALDGGHALFTIVEMITGKAPNEKFLERAQVVGMVIIFALIFFALGNDLFRVFFGKH
jgi:regulator of sigma E protease